MSPPRPGRWWPLLAVAFTLFAPACSQAATVYVTGTTAKTLHYEAAPGETNDLGIVSVKLPTGKAWSVIDNDPTVQITAGPGCTSDASWSASCAWAGVSRLEVSFGDGDDYFQAAEFPGTVQVSGGSGDDTLVAPGTARDDIDGGEGNDVISSYERGRDAIHGGNGDDLVRLMSSDDQKVSLDDVANDGLVGEGANVHSDVEQVETGSGNDTLIGSDGPDHLDGGTGSDVVRGEGGDDDLSGGYGDGLCATDEVYGGDGNDKVRLEDAGTADGGAGDDVLSAQPSCADTVITGGDGHDELRVLSYTDVPVTVSLDGVANDGSGPATANVLPDIERVVGGPGDDELIGSDHADSLDGGSGDDLLDGGAGADELTGGPGHDVVDYSSRSAPVTVDLDGQPSDDGEAGEGDTVGADVEDIWGGAGDDHLTGNDLANALDGGPGADVLVGLGGEDAADYSTRTGPVTVDLSAPPGGSGEAGENDVLASGMEDAWGGTGDDHLTGDDGANLLDGGDGNDVLDGRAGIDSLLGGADNDRLLSRDGVDDEVDCGDGTDAATGDYGDFYFGCETVDAPAQTSTSTSTPAPASPSRSPSRPVVRPNRPVRPIVASSRPPAAPKDGVAPDAVLGAPARMTLTRLLRTGVATSVSCSEGCTLRAELHLGPLAAKRLHLPTVFAAQAVTMSQRGTTRVVLKPSTRLRRTLARRHWRTLKLSVAVVATDAAGNARHVSRTLTIRR